MAEPVNFDRNKVLGRGGFGIVFYGIWNEKPVAVKRIPLGQNDDQQKENNLQSLDHPNVIKLFHAQSDIDFRYYVLELCSASLDKLFLEDGQKYSGLMPDQDQVLVQLANGLEYIHKKNLVHRDVKPANVLIWTENELVVMKWADFGLSKQVNQRGSHSVSSIKGTSQWMAPEILEMQQDNADDQSKKRGTTKSDVFAQGLVFGYFLSNGKHPFGDNPFKIDKNIKKHKIVNIDKIQSPLVRDLIGNMLISQPKDRMTSSDVVHQLKVIQEVEMKERQTKFFILCQEKNPNLKEMENLLEKGVDINCTNQQGLTPLLHLLAYQTTINHDNLMEIIEFFTSQGANVNCRNDYGENALLKVCVNYTKEDLIEIIRLFIAHGVDLNCQNKYQENILFYLGQYYSNTNLIDIFRLLIEHGIDINRQNEYGFNALPVVCRNYTGDNLIDLVRLFNNQSNSQSKEMALKFLVKYKRRNLMEITQLLAYIHPGQSSPSNLSPTQKRKHECI